MLKLAVIDMYNNESNLGLKSITDLLDSRFADISYSVFNLRGEMQLPDLSFDIYISTGGPGHPLDGVEDWGRPYFDLLDDLVAHNRSSWRQKLVFFICHSYQIACHHFGLGKITRRPRESFGIFPVRKTLEGRTDHLFQYLPDPFYAADFRKYQVTRPNFDRLGDLQAEILAIEHEARLPHSPAAIMAFRLGTSIYGTQFHPEAYPEGMYEHIMKPDRRTQIIEDHGATVYEEMLFHLRDPIKLNLTYQKILPQFLQFARKTLYSTSSLPVD